MKNKKVIRNVLAVLIGCLCLGGAGYGIYSAVISKADKQSDSAAAADADEEVVEPALPPIKDKDNEQETKKTELQEYDDGEKAETEQILQPLIDEAVTISDVYCLEGAEAIFYTYTPSLPADSYEWEFYNTDLAKWSGINELPDVKTGFEADSYNRNMSILRVPAEKTYDGIKFRCKIGAQDTIPTGYLHLIEPFEELEVPEEVQADANKLIYTRDIPVTIVYGEDKQEIQGLQGLYFSYEVSSTEDVSKNANEVTKTVTTISKEESSYMTRAGDNPLILRYREGDMESDYNINIIGTDSTPPTILSFEISDYVVSAADTDEGVDITASITAEDDCSDAADLRYYFGFESDENDDAEQAEPDQDDFTTKNTITISSNANGIYAIYVMDAAGNVAKETTELIVVDSKAPKLSVRLEYPDMDAWYESNVIHAEAEDGTELTYAYAFDGQDSGYIPDSSFTVTANGTWTVSAKDAAGNISSEEVIITNIDHTPPQILDVSFSSADMGALNQDSKDYLEKLKEDITSEVERNVADGKNGIKGTDGKDGRDGIDGTDGADGKAGKDGTNGKTTFIAYADDASGNNFSLTPLETSKYIGTCITTATKQPAERAAYSNWQPYRSHIITETTDDYGVTTMHIH